jgi:intracellular multiplication protein IcmC
MFIRIFALSLILLPQVAFAAFVERDLQDIMQNLQKVLLPAMGLLLSISFVAGVFFMLKGVMMLKAFSMPLTQASKPGEISGPLVYLFVGAIMIYIPTSTDIVSQTFFGVGGPSIFTNASRSQTGGSFSVNLSAMGRASDQILGYAPVSVEGQWAAMIDTIVLYMQFIGFIAFLRGWFMIAHAGQPGAQPGTITKGIVHIIGGILAINFLPLIKAIQNTISGPG